MKLIREHIILEKFIEDSDPIDDLEIGQKHLIHKWFKSLGVGLEKYTIDDNLNIQVKGDLDLRGIRRITELPDNLKIGGSLYLRGTRITELPVNLSIGGNLYLYGTRIIELPDNLSVGGDLDLRGTRITELPDNLSIGGDLYLYGIRITELPKSLKIRGKIFPV